MLDLETLPTWNSSAHHSFPPNAQQPGSQCLSLESATYISWAFIMAGPRDRSRHRGMESQTQYELQDIQPSHLNPMDEGFTAHSEDSYDEHSHGHPQNPEAQLLDRGLIRACKELLVGILETCQAQSARILRMCVEPLSKHRMMTLFTASILCILLLLAFRSLGPRPEPPDYGHHRYGTIAAHQESTVYRTVSAEYVQFHGAKPIHHQAPMAVSSNQELKGQAKRQDSLHLHVVTGTSTSVPGLYFMPMSITDADWTLTQRDTHPSYPASYSAANHPAPPVSQGSQSLGKSEPQAELLLQSRESRAPHNLSINQAVADTSSFTRWGVEVLYALRRRSGRNLQLNKGSCIENACSPHQQLVSMCNATKTIYNSFRKQECEWCWPENQRKHLAIEKHCTKVSERAFNIMVIICSIFLFCMLVVAIVLAPRMFGYMRKAKANCMFQEKATTASSLREESNSVPSRQLQPRISGISRPFKVAKSRADEKAIRKCSPDENVHSDPLYKPFTQASNRSRLQKHRTKPLDKEMAMRDHDSHTRVPILPPAPPTIKSQVFSEIEKMGQGILHSDAGTNISQHDMQGMPRRSAKQSRVVSSGSEQNPSQITHHRNAGSPNFYNSH